MTFHVGQKVVCINDQRLCSISRSGWFSRWRSSVRLNHNLNRGDIYRVTLIINMTTTSNKVVTMLHVDGARHFEYDIGFPSFQFRPVVTRKTDISIFTKLLTPSPQKVPGEVA